MVDLDILLVYEEETLEVLSELEKTTSLSYVLQYLKVVSDSSRVLELHTITELANQQLKSIEAVGEVNSHELKKFTTEVRCLIRSAIQKF